MVVRFSVIWYDLDASRRREPMTGLEPATRSLQMNCSTNWATLARRQKIVQSFNSSLPDKIFYRLFGSIRGIRNFGLRGRISGSCGIGHPWKTGLTWKWSWINWVLNSLKNGGWLKKQGKKEWWSSDMIIGHRFWAFDGVLGRPHRRSIWQSSDHKTNLLLIPGHKSIISGCLVRTAMCRYSGHRDWVNWLNRSSA